MFFSCKVSKSSLSFNIQGYLKVVIIGIYMKKTFVILYLLASCVIGDLAASQYDDVKKALDVALKNKAISTEIYKSTLGALKSQNEKKEPHTTPDETWVNHTIEVSFDGGGWSNKLKFKTKKLKITGYGVDSDGYKYLSVKDLTDGYLSQLFVFWFNNKNGRIESGPNIDSYKFLSSTTNSQN
jgi:hypothetical protein